MKTNGDFDIDLSSSFLYCFQTRVNQWKVASLVEAIKAGEQLPPISVVELGENVYLLDTSKPNADDNRYLDGGHHRIKAQELTTGLVRAVLNPDGKGTLARIFPSEIRMYNDRRSFEVTCQYDQRYRMLPKNYFETNEVLS